MADAYEVHVVSTSGSSECWIKWWIVRWFSSHYRWPDFYRHGQCARALSAPGFNFSLLVRPNCIPKCIGVSKSLSMKCLPQIVGFIDPGFPGPRKSDLVSWTFFVHSLCNVPSWGHVNIPSPSLDKVDHPPNTQRFPATRFETDAIFINFDCTCIRAFTCSTRPWVRVSELYSRPTQCSLQFTFGFCSNNM